MSYENDKLKKAVELIRQKDLDGLIIYSSGMVSILRPSYLYYFTGFRPFGPRSAAVISKTGEVALLVTPSWDATRAFKKSWIKDVRGSSDFNNDLAGILKELKITGSVGIAGLKELKEDTFIAVQREAIIKSGDDITEKIAAEKTQEDLDIIKEASQIADIGFQVFLENARVGIREYELVTEMEYAMRIAGSEDFFILLSSEKHNYEMHEPTNKRLRAGDIVIGEISSVYRGQFVQLCRTVILGQPSPVVIEKYNMLLHALDESLKEVKPGNQASLMSITMNKVISEAGYEKYCYPPYMRARGHGVGVGSNAPGTVIDYDTKLNFAQNQAVVVHPNQYIPETGYLACGETFLVTDNGAERLAETETKLYIKEHSCNETK